ncbi:MBOAT family O-acyltransferase [Butyrivibrio sp. LB2008]|uniref:MBOAT family O-acyltransferase n=1 Tax=Butyrivibrio sp. LB2008 TaxID=1408305 RepID=UPI00047D6EDB|nr:MBOAT family O-acyltransferase [Butyrivibrio sp. LB2008]
MLFNSYGFMLLFLPIFLAAYFLIRTYIKDHKKKEGMLNLLMVLGSLVFYGLFDFRNTVIFCMSIFLNINAINIIRMKKNSKVRLGICIAANVAILCFFKFRGTFFPVAISFYTFNQISYLIDLYRGDIEEHDLMNYLIYILFFPKILQGPLMNYSDFIGGLKKAYDEDLDWEKIMRGMLLLSIGMFKKVILADTFAKAVDYGFSSIPNLGRMEAILSAVFYSFQLYFDFSGYCDVAAAICLMMGFELALNFNSPYKAVDIDDFWDRWHITLTKFFTKYVYIPLGGNRKGRLRTYENIFTVFLLSGIWHGNGLTFVVWGIMHGILSIVTRIVKNKKKAAGEKAQSKAVSVCKRIFGIIFTYAYVTAAWVFFRAEKISDALLLFKRMAVGGIRPFYSTFADGFNLDEIWYVIKVTPLMKLSFAWDICLWLFLIVGAGIIFFGKNAVSYSKECKINLGTTVLTAVLLVWSIISFSGVSTFLYMNF